VVIVVAVTLASLPAYASTVSSRDIAWQRAVHADVHATRGVVKFIDATTLVIERTRQRGDMMFLLTPFTSREGLIRVGAVVSVRYREDGAGRRLLHGRCRAEGGSLLQDEVKPAGIRNVTANVIGSASGVGRRFLPATPGEMLERRTPPPSTAVRLQRCFG